MRNSSAFGLVRRGACAALVGAVLLGAVAPASAGDRTGAVLGGAALGMLGGVALGAALASPPPPPYRPRPVYVVAPPPPPPPVYVPVRRGPVCHFEQRKQWLNEVEFTYRRVEVCE